MQGSLRTAGRVGFDSQCAHELFNIKEMKTIQIAPNKGACRIDGKKVIGTMDGRTFVFELPERVRMPEDESVRETMINNFCEAIALCSKQWQVEDLLNRHWNIKGGKFYEK